MDKKSFYFIVTILCVLTATVALFFYAKGYSFNGQNKTLEKTGMISVKSEPDGARVYLDGKLAETTNSSLTNLKGGLYHLKLEKDGYFSWQKDVPVKEEFVTYVDAVLVPLNPELKPLTTNGVKSPVLTKSRDKIIFLTADKDRPGIWSLSLTGNLFELFQGNLNVLAPDQPSAAFSLADKLELSPDDQTALITMNKGGFYTLDLTASQIIPQATTSAAPAHSTWASLTLKNKQNLAKKYKVPQNMTEAATDPKTIWSPDERRFLYSVESGNELQYHVFDTTDPLGVGERQDYATLNLPKTQHAKATWYSDSKHLIVVTCTQENKDQRCLTGSIHLIRIDGTNDTQVYSGALSSVDVFPTPDGTKIIILTSFNENSSPNLYAIILR